MQPATTTTRMILGAPGTGKTEELLRSALEFLNDDGNPAHLLVLTPSRVSATRFREDLTARANRTMSTAPVRAWQAYAFDVIRRAHVEGLLPGLEFNPKLISGPEQDVMIGELLAGHAAGEGAAIFWPADLHEALPTRGFRHEIRDFFDRMAEYQLSAEQVKELAQQWNRPEWDAVARLHTEYQQVRRLRMPHGFDPAALIHQACTVFLENPEFLAKEREQLQLVLIDDMQEATPAIYRLLDILCGAESSPEPAPHTHITLCTDTVVQGFRGARPQYAGQLKQIFPHAQLVSLQNSYRMPAKVAEAWSAVATRIPVVPGVRHPRTLAQPEREPEEQALWELGDDGSLLDPIKSQPALTELTGITVESPQHEARFVAQQLLEDYLYRGKSYARSAIIVRNGADISRFKRVLQSQGIPVQTSNAATSVRDEPAVRPFLDALALVLQAKEQQIAAGTTGAEIPSSSGSRKLGVDVALALLTSRLGNASPMDVRRLRQRLRANELRAGGNRASDELIVEALLDSSTLPEGEASVAARRINRVLAAGTAALEVEGANAETVLWALWGASGLGTRWRHIAMKNGVGSERAHRDLDAMIGLFEAAARYANQMPGATPAQFLDYIEAQDLPMDTLAQRGAQGAAVEIMTPALAAGRQWDTVYVAGLQEGSWPNTTVRGSLLNTQQLVDIVDLGPEAARSISFADRLRDTRYDELRMFSTAISRASEHLVCTAVSSGDDEPSEFLDIVAPAPGGERVKTEVRRPMTLRALIAELRQWAENPEDPYLSLAAIELLRRLNDRQNTAGLELPGVSPGSWWGMLPLSSSGSGFAVDRPVPISPSRVATILKSPLDWFVSASRAEAATDVSRSLGTLVHEIAEDMPNAPSHELIPELHRRITRLGLPDTWESHKLVERAETMLGKFASYVAELSSDGRELVGVEGSFSVLVPGPAKDALLSGRVDRLERNRLGNFVIIDLKTGANQPAKADLERHPQLASYQVALEAGAGQQMAQTVRATGDQDLTHEKARPEELLYAGVHELSGGAVLVQLGTSAKKYNAQEQPPLEEKSTWAAELINRAAELISGPSVQARHASSAGFGIQCSLPEICPLCSRGRQVTQI